MNRYITTMEKLRKNNRGAFIAFTVIGDPDPETSLSVINSLVDGGADVLELGMPFSDPIADGPTIQAADNRALAHGMDTDKAFMLIRKIRQTTDIPIGILVYANIVVARGISTFYYDAKKAGVDSILVADLPIEEADEYIEAASKAQIETVFMVTPLTPEERTRKIVSKTTGFIYLVSRLGVTGAAAELQKDTLELIKRVRPYTTLPLFVGFGISKPEHVKAVLEAGADGAIVGSAIVSKIEGHLGDTQGTLSSVRALSADMLKACDRIH